MKRNWIQKNLVKIHKNPEVRVRASDFQLTEFIANKHCLVQLKLFHLQKSVDPQTLHSLLSNDKASTGKMRRDGYLHIS